jgi:tRNA 2-thiouridine synthesizing protein A
MADVFVDAKGLACPMPIVKAKKALDSLQPGQTMEVHTTEKGSMNDFPAWIKRSNHELIEAKEENGVFKFIIKKG